MPKRTIYQSDFNGDEVLEGREVYLTMTYPAVDENGQPHPMADEVVHLVITDAEAADLRPEGAKVTKKRGRKPADANGGEAAAAPPAAAAGKK